MALLLAVAVLVTGAAAVALVAALNLADANVERLVSAQHRLDLLSSISGRVGDYALVALQAARAEDAARNPTGDAGLAGARQRVAEAFGRFERALGEDVARLSDEEARTLIAARSRIAARLKAQFDVLDRQIATSLAVPGNDTGVRVALDVFAAGFGAPLGQAIEDERATARSAQQAIHDLRARTLRWAVAGAALAVLVAVALYQMLARPVVDRIADVAAAAAAIARGRTDTRLTVAGHDELSLAMARFNRMAAHLARREGRLVADQTRLREIVDARTAELRQANSRLEAVDQARRRFFTDVSHELRTPLTVILGEAEVTLRQAEPAPQDLRAALVVIQSRARRLHRRVEDLLRVARSETGQIELDRILVPVADLLEEVRESAAPLARATGNPLDVVCPHRSLAVEADREWLRQVIEGLVDNAVRHSPPGQPIRIEADAEGDSAVIRVVDRGRGIPRDELPHVFERFWRGGDGSREGAGFGIGLALAKWIVERQDGGIEVESVRQGEEGGPSGTVVTLRFPAVLPHLTLEAAQ
ncbi:sensor histidine kinase [Ancylobacter terrae]|uniref:sensor histidine kinase n=1 Tax=Ancylobacter sp. sgz301288 TaxID=3342077 RepID=UPI00385C30AE